MPKLVLFAICRDAILDQEDNTVSLMCILNGLTISGAVKPGTPTQIEWGAVSVWKRSDDDVAGETYEARVQVRLPDGTRHGEATSTFGMVEDRSQLIINGTVLPLWQAGEIAFVLEMRVMSQDVEWNLCGEFPLLITHAPSLLIQEQSNHSLESIPEAPVV